MASDIKKMLKLAMIMMKGSSYSGEQNNGLKKNKNKWLYPVLALCLLPTLASMIIMIAIGYTELSAVGDAYIIIRSYLTISAILTLILGFFYAVSILFFSTDNDILSHLPLHSWQICGARFLVILFFEYIFEAFVFIPMFITYGIMAGCGALFYVYSVIIGALLPVLPIAVLSIITMLLVRFIPFFKSKDKINFFTTILSIILVLAIYLPFMSDMNSDSESVAPLFYSIAGPDSAASTLMYVLPTLLLAFEALSAQSILSGLLYILLFIIANILSFALFMFISKLMYSKALNSITDSAKSRKKLSESELYGNTARTSAIKALTIKEIRLLLRSPIYFMNCVLSPIIFPLIFGAAALFSEDIGTFLPEIRNFFQTEVASILPIMLAGVSLFTAFIGGVGSLTSTAISREGSQISFSKMFPVPYFKQLKAKLYSGIMLSAIPFTLIIVAGALLIGAGIYTVYFGLITFLTFTVTLQIGLLIDMGRPKLLWDNEQAAVKQNINGFLGMILTIPVVIVAALPSVLAFSLLQLDMTASCILNIAFLILAYRLFMTLIYKKSDSCYENIQI